MRSKEEEIVNAYTHLLWCILTVVMLGIFLIDPSVQPRFKTSSLMMLGLSSWTFFSSYLYHASSSKKKSQNREVDKTSIFLMILGSGASINMATLNNSIASISCAAIILIGSLLTAIYAHKKEPSEVFSVTSYVLLGWLCVLPLTGILGENLYQDSLNTHLIILGGILYSAGILFYARDSIKWNHTKWHFFVMAGFFTHVIAHYRVAYTGIY